MDNPQYIPLAVIGLFGGLLSIARTKWTPGEKWAIRIGVVAVGSGAGYYFSRSPEGAALSALIVGIVYGLGEWLFGKLKSWLSRRIPSPARWFRTFAHSMQIAKILPPEADARAIKRISGWIIGHVREAPADLSEVKQVLCGAPVLESLAQAARQATMDSLQYEFFEAQLVWFRWHEVAGHAFDFQFEDFVLLSPPENRLVRTKSLLMDDILKRFATHQFQTIVYVLRDSNNPRIGRFLEELGTALHCAIIGVPVDPARTAKDRAYDVDLINACRGKSILLVEPLMIDSGLDIVFDTVKGWNGIVNGVVVMCEVKGTSPSSLRNHTDLLAKSGQTTLRGQLLLDLRESH